MNWRHCSRRYLAARSKWAGWTKRRRRWNSKNLKTRWKREGKADRLYCSGEPSLFLFQCCYNMCDQRFSAIKGSGDKRRILLVGIHTIIYGTGEFGYRLASFGWIRQVVAHDGQNVAAVRSKNDSGIVLGARQLAGFVATDGIRR